MKNIGKYNGIPCYECTHKEYVNAYNNKLDNGKQIFIIDGTMVKQNVIVGKCGSTGLTRNGTLLTDANGHLEFINLYPGIHYRVTEENTVNGYTLLTAPHDIAPDDVEIQTLTYDMRVVNTPGYELPESGVSDMSTNLMVIGGTCAAVLVMFGMFSLHTETSVFRRRRTIKNKK